MDYSLVDAEERASANEAFEIPSASERGELKVGQCAKLIFVGEQEAERMWVEIKAVRGCAYEGILRSQALDAGLPRRGGRVTFEARHVIDIWLPHD